MSAGRLFFAVVTAVVLSVRLLAQIAAPVESKNLKIIGHNDLNQHGNGGEGLMLKQYPNGRRILFLAHESAPLCFSVIDVTKPSQPTVVTQVPIQAADIRCNSLDVSKNTLIVAHQTAKAGLPNGGVRIYDISDYANPRELAFFD